MIHLSMRIPCACVIHWSQPKFDGVVVYDSKRHQLVEDTSDFTAVVLLAPACAASMLCDGGACGGGGGGTCASAGCC